jgi:hypothetical protein
MKEFEEPKTLQRKIEENSEVNMEFLEDLSQIFGAHDSRHPLSSGQYAEEVEGLSGVRLESVEPVGPPVGIHTGFSADCGAETGGLPPNDLQEYVLAMCAQKSLKSKKRKLVYDMLSPNALTTVALLVEELVTEMVLSWRRRIDSSPAGGEEVLVSAACDPGTGPDSATVTATNTAASTATSTAATLDTSAAVDSTLDTTTSTTTSACASSSATVATTTNYDSLQGKALRQSTCLYLLSL